MRNEHEHEHDHEEGEQHKRDLERPICTEPLAVEVAEEHAVKRQPRLAVPERRGGEVEGTVR